MLIMVLVMINIPGADLSVGRTEVHHQLGVAVKTGAAEATFLRRQCRAELTGEGERLGDDEDFHWF